MISELLLVVGVGLIVYSFYKWATLNNDYFLKRNLPYKKPTFLLGGAGGFVLGRYTMWEFGNLLYNSLPNERMYGIFDFRTPMVVVRDPELIKLMAVKHFDHFEDHRTFIDSDIDELLGNGLFMMRGQKWREMRAALSPAFTGRRMRQMFELVTECADDMANYFLKQSTEGKKVDFEIKNLFSHYTNDVIASCAFGIRVNSFKHPDNEFFVTSKKLFGGNYLFLILRFIIITVCPWLAKKFGIHFISSSVGKYFVSMVINMMEERTKRNIFRPDLINMLMDLRQGKLIEEATKVNDGNAQNDSAGFATVEESDIGKKAPKRQWTDKELVAQALLFMLAGFDMTAAMCTFLAYEVCVNPDVQQKLYEEIIAMNESLDGKRISYETLQKMKYLDQVVSETMRKCPPPMVDRVCVKEYECEYGDGAKFRFEKGVAFWIPIYGLHYDPKYFPDPEKFDPERFSDDNKRNIVPGTYLPFGIGPRNCIGSRFVLMELKATLYYILLNFSLEPNAKTQIPLRLKKSPFGFQTEGLFMDFVPRTQPPQ